jgi:hypothetical protein
MFGVKFSSSISSSNWPPELAQSTVSPPTSCEPIKPQSEVATQPLSHAVARDLGQMLDASADGWLLIAVRLYAGMGMLVMQEVGAATGALGAGALYTMPCFTECGSWSVA